MQCIRDSYIDNLNILSIDYCPPISSYLFPSPLRSDGFELLTIPSADDLRPGPILSLEKMSYLVESIGMNFPNESVTDHGHIQGLFGLLHWLFHGKWKIYINRSFTALTASLLGSCRPDELVTPDQSRKDVRFSCNSFHLALMGCP